MCKARLRRRAALGSVPRPLQTPALQRHPQGGRMPQQHLVFLAVQHRLIRSLGWKAWKAFTQPSTLVPGCPQAGGAVNTTSDGVNEGILRAPFPVGIYLMFFSREVLCK